MDPPFPPLRRLQVSRRTRRGQEDDGPQAVGHALGEAPIALDILRDGVQSAPFLHHQHGRDGNEAIGPAQHGSARPKHDRHGRDHDRHHHGPTHCGGRHETSGAGNTRTREDFLQLQREPLLHREHMPGAGRMA